MDRDQTKLDLKEIVDSFNICKGNQSKLESFLDFLHKISSELEHRRTDCVNRRLARERCIAAGVEPELVTEPLASVDQIIKLDETIKMLHEIERTAVWRLDYLTSEAI
jgi:phosphate uptake regulator